MTQHAHTPGPDWYDRRDQLHSEMIFRTADGFVKLDRRVPGDGTRWYVDDWYNGHWCSEDSEIEPGDLIGQPLCCDDEVRAAIAKATGGEG